MQKKKWNKPELVLLIRANIQETVLQGCKTNITHGANNKFSACYYNPSKWSICGGSCASLNDPS